jgi:hypothetical protein
MRTRAHNAGIKKWRLVNEYKAAKAQREPDVEVSTLETRPSGLQVSPGDRFGKLTAVEPAETDAKGNRRWTFQCDCGAMVTWRVSTVTSNVRRLGWCSCPCCYLAAGGWQGIGQMKRTQE